MTRLPGPAAARGASRGLLALAILALAQVATTAADAAELIMLEGRSCGRCQQFRAEVAPGYGATPTGRAMPLRVVDIEQRTPWFRLASPVEGTPTFLLVDRGQEIGRITGYSSRESFYAQAQRLAAVLPRPRARPPRTRTTHVSAHSAAQQVR